MKIINILPLRPLKAEEGANLRPLKAEEGANLRPLKAEIGKVQIKRV